jgi:hypothetical protein
MLVHAVVAFAPLAAASFLLTTQGIEIGGIGPETWSLLLWISLIGILVIALPSTLTGVSERNHMYANWPPSHRAKLLLSLVLIVLVAGEIMALRLAGTELRLASLLGFAIVVGNCVVVFGLSFYGLKISLGRQGFGPTSYKADMDWDPPLDVLACVADYSGDAPKLIDVQKEKQA